ncbi:hypothetical protein SJAV_19110 [Sulfurisphaera javensis]|uniref:Uncharacterized protein n=1 Tax=Sulfurisphaera javensis TaxID=2049879 RepID=A0AAT9GSU0_9CREN
MNSHVYLAKHLLELSKNSSDNIIKLQALLRCVEELAIYKYKIDDSMENYQKITINFIKNDKELYDLYSIVLDLIFYYLLGGENINVSEIEEKINEKINQIKEI